MKKVMITASVLLGMTVAATAAFADPGAQGVDYTPIPIKDANGHVIAQTTSIPLGNDVKLPVYEVHDANGNVIGQTRNVKPPEPINGQKPDQKPQDSFGGMHYVIVVDGKAIKVGDEAGYTKGDQLMVPLRAVSEALGYKVEWNQEQYSADVTKATVWSPVHIGKDSYSFGKIAPQTLGAAPELKQEVTFVPLSFFSEILKHKLRIDETGVIIFEKQSE